MRSMLQKTQLVQLIEQRNGYLVLACGLTLLCLLLATLCFYLANRERVVITPPVIDKPFWITNSEVSSEYLTKMTIFFSDLRFNLTPENADYYRTQLLHYTDPHYYGEFNNVLVAERDHITQQHISTVFYPIDTDIDTKALTAVITGDLISSVGTTRLPAQRVAYQWMYRYHNGRLLITELQEVKPHE